jgi:hypothetical protein
VGATDFKKFVIDNESNSILRYRETQGEFCLLRNNAAFSVKIQPTFWMNKSPPSSGMKSKPRKKSA